jgi:hypothetical protein
MNIFKPLKIDERLEPRRKELVDKGIIVITINDNSTKTLTFNHNMRYTEYMILCTFYKDYIVNVNGYVDLYNENLYTIDIQFNNVSGYFNCANNHLSSLRNCPKYVGDTLWCHNNSKKFTKEEVLKVCDVKGNIYVYTNKHKIYI